MSRLKTTSFAVLGLIANAPTSTYELARRMRLSNLRAFWSRAESQIYNEPKQLEAAGLTDGKVEYVGERKRTVYRATRAGRTALRKWLAEPSSRFQYRSEAAVKVSFANYGTIEALRSTLRAAQLEAEDDAREMLAVAKSRKESNSPVPAREHANAVADALILEVIEARIRWARMALALTAGWTSCRIDDSSKAQANTLWETFETRLEELLADALPTEAPEEQ